MVVNSTHASSPVLNTPADPEELFAEIETLIVAEVSAAGIGAKRDLIDTAIRKANTLVESYPTVADAHYMLGVSWYHHPDKDATRSNHARAALLEAIAKEPSHHFAHQYLGYLNYDEGRYDDASPHFRAVDFQFFVSIGQVWRALKAMELAFACELRLGRDLDAVAFENYAHEYRQAMSAGSSNLLPPSELRLCAEEIFARRADATTSPLSQSLSPPLTMLLAFLEAVGELQNSPDTALKQAWAAANSD